nr:hypothetical protein [Pedobacter schmidteae]
MQRRKFYKAGPQSKGKRREFDKSGSGVEVSVNWCRARRREEDREERSV